MRLHALRPHWSSYAMDSVDVITRKFPILMFEFLIIVTMANAANESDALLRLKTSFTNEGILQSWQPGTNPCENQPWEGIICTDGSVYGLRLEGLNLSGTVDIDALSQLPDLRTLSVMSNSFSGPIPPLNRLVPLRALYLSQNQFSGEIPGDYFTGMKYLKKLWLSVNLFSGPIPSSLDQIPLIELHLENNQFSGVIPKLNQESITDISMANNNLTGPIPPGLSRFDEIAFEGNPGLCGGKSGKPCQEQPQEPPPKVDGGKGHSGKSRLSTISKYIMIVCAVTFAIMVILIIFLRHRQRKRQELLKEDEDVGDEMIESGRTITPTNNNKVQTIGSGEGSRSSTTELILMNDEKYSFGMQDLLTAAAEVIGTGVMGSTYKAMMGNGLTVAVKRIKEMDRCGKDDFDAEIRNLGSFKHKNVLAPIAYHYRTEEKLLVTEYMPKGSLLYLLHGDRGSPNIELKWAVRFKIIEGIAKGLYFIHTENYQSELPHGNLKSSNVLLTDEYEPLLSDYGFISLFNDTQAAQTLFAYRTPEALENQHVSPRCDIYCMGIIILEILTGKFPSQYVPNGKGGTDIVQWARSAIHDGREVELFYADIASSSDSLPDMKQLLHIGVACTEPEPENRLSIRDAISRIEALHYMGSQSHEEHEEVMTPASGPSESAELELWE